MAERGQERHAKDMFDSWLRDNYPLVPISWKKVSQELEPPDYFLQLGTTKYAVEVTSLFFPEYARDGKNVARPAIEAMLRASFDKLIKSLSERGTLKGFYNVLIEGPLERYSTLKTELHFRVAEMIEETRDEEVLFFPARQIAHEGFTLLVTKLGLETTDIGWCVASAAGSDTASELATQIDAAISIKASKLKGVAEPAILLLLDETYASTPVEYFEVAKQLELPHSFKAIFVVTVPRGLNKFVREKVFSIYPFSGGSCSTPVIGFS